MPKLSEVKLKCLRHRIAPSDEKCKLCEAKKEANGNFERSRRLFIGAKKQI